jgi:hypothetical protein
VTKFRQAVDVQIDKLTIGNTILDIAQCAGDSIKSGDLIRAQCLLEAGVLIIALALELPPESLEPGSDEKAR